MNQKILLFLLAILSLISCEDDDSFTQSSSARLTFSIDTLQMDTLFSSVPSTTYTFWVYNRNDDGLRLSAVRLLQGNQTGFRVNVDGSYLDNQLGSVIRDLEVRGGDSLRVFVELTPSESRQHDPQLVEDHLLFTLESGVEQRMNLRAWTWDAQRIDSLVVSHDTLVSSGQPLVIYGGIRIDSAATLTIRNSTLYFHDRAGIDVYGRLLTDSVVMRGDRLDHMFDYLPYDRVSGQWKGVRIFRQSTGNVLSRTEIRNATYGLICDSARYDSIQPRIEMSECVVHNCKGPGVQAYNSFLRLSHCQLTNTLGDCLSVYGGLALVESCTLAQFYPFSANRGVALRFSNQYQKITYPLNGLVCLSSIVTGYEADVIMGESGDTTALFDYYFENSLLRTPLVEDSLRFKKIIWETAKDSVQGKRHFVLIDEKNLKYDFHLDSISPAQGLGAY